MIDHTGRHILTEKGESLTVFRMNGNICVARGRQEPDETMQMTPIEALELADRLMEEADFERSLSK